MLISVVRPSRYHLRSQPVAEIVIRGIKKSLINLKEIKFIEIRMRFLKMVPIDSVSRCPDVLREKKNLRVQAESGWLFTLFRESRGE